MTACARLAELGIVLPEPMQPASFYRPAVRVGELVFLSGAGPVRPDGTIVTGKVGADSTSSLLVTRRDSRDCSSSRRCRGSWAASTTSARW